MIWSDEECKEQEEPFNEVMVLDRLATSEDPLVGVASNAASSPRANTESSDDEEISDEEMVRSYRVIYKKMVEALNENQDLQRQVSLLSNEKEELVKQNNIIQDKVCQQEESLCELEPMKKFVRMLNSSTTTLKCILEMGKKI